MEKPVKLETINDIAIITLNRPKAYNAFGEEMIRLLADILNNVSINPDIGGVILTGSGKAFCTGGDLKWLTNQDRAFGEMFYELAGILHRGILEIRNMQKPVIAAVNGLACGGGFSMALSCDFRIMEKQAILQQRYTSNGLSFDGGGSFMLPRLLGTAKALEIAAFDPPITADDAKNIGLATEVADEGESVEKSISMLKKMDNIALSSFSAAKKLFNESFQLPLEVQLERERDFLAECSEHINGREGISAFLEKRRPAFHKKAF